MLTAILWLQPGAPRMGEASRHRSLTSNSALGDLLPLLTGFLCYICCVHHSEPEKCVHTVLDFWRTVDRRAES
jgi:hypothetical protein